MRSKNFAARYAALRVRLTIASCYDREGAEAQLDHITAIAERVGGPRLRAALSTLRADVELGIDR